MDKAMAEQFYGKDAAEWLRRWDAGDTVWSVEMGGIGPGYEQAIQIAAAEALRELIALGFDLSAWSVSEDRKEDEVARWDAACFANATVRGLGLSGAQFGAACNVAGVLYSRGPVDALTDPAIGDRKIQVSKSFPSFPSVSEVR